MLPIGSIVYLKEGTSKLMILNRGPLMYSEDKGRKMFDYSGCLYPGGLDPENIFYFNKENIDEVVFEGFSDDEEERFLNVYKQWLEENQSSIQKGEVT